MQSVVLVSQFLIFPSHFGLKTFVDIEQEDGSSFEEGMLKLLRTLPKVLKYLPSDKAKDARNFMMSFQVFASIIARF